MFKKVVVLVLCCAAVSWPCDKGYSEWEGVCAAEIAPEVAPSVKPSDEKPPRSGLPAWQSPDVHIVDAPNMTSEDAKQDAARNDADIIGKKAAGLK